MPELHTSTKRPPLIFFSYARKEDYIIGLRLEAIGAVTGAARVYLPPLESREEGSILDPATEQAARDCDHFVQMSEEGAVWRAWTKRELEIFTASRPYRVPHPHIRRSALALLTLPDSMVLYAQALIHLERHGSLFP